VAEKQQPVTIVGGSGALGFGIAVRLGQAGVPIIIGSREEERAQQASQRAKELVPDGNFTGAQNKAAVKDVPIIILSVPFRNQSETLTNLKQVLEPGQIVIDATVPLAAAVSGKAFRSLGVWQGSAAQQTAEMVPDGVNVVSALHTVSASALSDLSHTLDEDILLAGDRKEDKRHVAKLLEKIDGLRCVNCGKLEMARITEQITPLLIAINSRYKTHAGVKIVGLPEKLWEK